MPRAARHEPDEISQPEAQRLDKWLFCARAAKSRSSATAMIESGHVRLNGAKVKTPAKTVRVGDVLTIALGHDVLVYRIAELAERRGPAVAANQLYERLAGESGKTPKLVAIMVESGGVSDDLFFDPGRDA